MSKKRIKNWIPVARRAITECEIESGGKIEATFIDVVAELGAAIISGTLRSAVAYFSEKGDATVDRRKVVSAAYYCISGKRWAAGKVLEYVYENESPDLKEEFLDALAAIRYATKFFMYVNKEEQNEQS
ncbi:MAG: hypothetical protein IKL42_00940 [Clostridia bacterium]|nr:hypothetical protein [Clostridia bacterium]MBR3575952.1 hypothetical protein [Clostridia bacterium]